jgi:chemotaxis signal transduction protein
MNDGLSPVMAGPFLVFDIGAVDLSMQAGTYAIDVSHVFQVIEPGRVSPVPLAPAVVLGILNHHGRVVTLVDPAPLLALERQAGPVTQAVILRQGVRSPANLGFRVSRIHGIVARGDLAEVDVDKPPCVAWVAQSGRRLIHIVALEPLLERLSRLFESVDSRPLVKGVLVPGALPPAVAAPAVVTPGVSGPAALAPGVLARGVTV